MMKKSAVVLVAVLILLLIPASVINLRMGVHLGEYFFMPHDNKDNSWTYRALGGGYVTLDWCQSGTGCDVSVKGNEHIVQLDWTGDWVRLEFEDGAVYEGKWTGESLLDADGKPLWFGDEGMIQIVVGDEEPPLGKYVIACALCKMDRKELTSFGSVWVVITGMFIYAMGMLNVLYPEKMHFLGNRWRYDGAALSDAGHAAQVLGGAVLLIVGAAFLYLPLWI